MRRSTAVWLVLLVAAGPARAEAPQPPLNVVLVSLDTVRPDRLGCYGHRRATSPELDRLAAESTVFLNAFSQAPSTFPSHLSIFTSRYPRLAWIEQEDPALEDGVTSLPERLRAHGYATAAFVGLSPRHRETSKLLASRPLQAFEHVQTEVLLRDLPEALYAWLAQPRTQPFLLFVHGFDAHDPHVLPSQYEARRFDPDYAGPVPSTDVELAQAAALTPQELAQTPWNQLYVRAREAYMQRLLRDGQPRPEDLAHMAAVYDAQIREADAGLGRLWTALRNLGLMDRTLIVVFSDHGEAFGEHGQYAYHAQCYDELLRMVLIIRDPRLPARRVTPLVQGVDILPTVLDRLGLPAEARAAGRSLAPLMRGEPDAGREEVTAAAWRGMRSVRTPRWKLIARVGAGDELYDLRADPQERHNVLARHPDAAASLRPLLEARVPSEHDAQAAPTDIERWIREQGYW